MAGDSPSVKQTRYPVTLTTRVNICHPLRTSNEQVMLGHHSTAVLVSVTFFLQAAPHRGGQR